MIRTLAALAAASLALGLSGGGSAARAASPGQAVFTDNCAACHQETGLGIPGAFPALKGSRIVQGDPAVLARLLLAGKGGMPAFKATLSRQQLADVATYIRGAWGNKAAPMKAADF